MIFVRCFLALSMLAHVSAGGKEQANAALSRVRSRLAKFTDPKKPIFIAEKLKLSEKCILNRVTFFLNKKPHSIKPDAKNEAMQSFKFKATVEYSADISQSERKQIPIPLIAIDAICDDPPESGESWPENFLQDTCPDIKGKDALIEAQTKLMEAIGNEFFYRAEEFYCGTKPSLPEGDEWNKDGAAQVRKTIMDSLESKKFPNTKKLTDYDASFYFGRTPLPNNHKANNVIGVYFYPVLVTKINGKLTDIYPEEALIRVSCPKDNDGPVIDTEAFKWPTRGKALNRYSSLSFEVVDAFERAALDQLLQGVEEIKCKKQA